MIWFNQSHLPQCFCLSLVANFDLFCKRLPFCRLTINLNLSSTPFSFIPLKKKKYNYKFLGTMQEMIRCLKQKDSDFMVSLSVCVYMCLFRFSIGVWLYLWKSLKWTFFLLLFFLTIITLSQIISEFSLSCFPHILLPSSRLCTLAKVISFIDSYHELVNWSITPAPRLLNASLINYCRPMGLRVGRLPARIRQIKMNFHCLCSLECQSHSDLCWNRLISGS